MVKSPHCTTYQPWLLENSKPRPHFVNTDATFQRMFFLLSGNKFEFVGGHIIHRLLLRKDVIVKISVIWVITDRRDASKLWSREMKYKHMARMSDKSMEDQGNGRYPLPLLKRKLKMKWCPCLMEDKMKPHFELNFQKHIISLKHCTGIILRCQPWEKWARLKPNQQLHSTDIHVTVTTYC